MSAEDGSSSVGRLLPTVAGPQDVKRMSAEQLTILAAEIRDFLVAKAQQISGAH